MSAYKTIELERTGDGDITFTSTETRWRMDGFPANAQISVSGLGGGTYTISVLPAQDTAYREIFTGVTEIDLATIAGREAPIFHAIKISVSGSGGGTITALLTLWARSI